MEKIEYDRESERLYIQAVTRLNELLKAYTNLQIENKLLTQRVLEIWQYLPTEAKLKLKEKYNG